MAVLIRMVTMINVTITDAIDGIIIVTEHHQNRVTTAMESEL